MTRKEIEAILSRIRFRPGWTFRLDDAGDIVATAKVRNARRRHPSTVRVRGYAVNAVRCETEAAVLAHAYDAASSILHHEASEWFRYRGRRPFNPHT